MFGWLMLELKVMGAKERSENLAATCFMSMRHHLHFAGASRCSHSTAQHLVTCPLGARNLVQRSINISAQYSVGPATYHTPKMDCDVEHYHLSSGQFSSFWAWTTLQHTSPQNSLSTTDTSSQ